MDIRLHKISKLSPSLHSVHRNVFKQLPGVSHEMVRLHERAEMKASKIALASFPLSREASHGRGEICGRNGPPQ